MTSKLPRFLVVRLTQQTPSQQQEKVQNKNSRNMSAQQSQGIQALLDAEKEAARIVEKAREYRSQKLKDARGEAAKEIESLKSKREEEFKEFEQQHSGNTDSQQKVLEEETKQKIELIKSEFNQNKAKVVSDLLSKVTDVHPELHRNYKLGIHQLSK
ncbi:hypothetical protein H4Q26_013506 [Puccinia striiformis f. sp. tritici PST-130]|nr:hypothetical protein H4Q26_013506 [Puccinia striiformis f. sp. tritici PST-130]